MKIKQKFIKEKQMTDRPQLSIKTNTDSTPLLTKLQKEYLINQPNTHKTTRQIYVHNEKKDKENYYNMVNSVPTNVQFMSHNVINIDNYENKKFVTQHGYQPMMTKSRYMGERDQNYQNFETSAIYRSTENLLFKKNDNQRPLTFGLIKKVQPMKSSVEYQQDIRMKNQILNQISSLRKSQQTLTNSKDCSISMLAEIPRCVNHSNKKAKYRLVAECEGKEEQDMIYCSKCAINLLQQGFKVEQMKSVTPVNKKLNVNNQHLFISQVNKNMLGSVGASSRIQEMRIFQQRLNQVQNKINISLQDSQLKTNQIQEIERQVWQTESLYEQMIQHLHHMKKQEIGKLNDKKNKRMTSLQAYQKQSAQDLESINQMKREMNQFRNKFIIMKQNEFQFLINSFLNKIQTYGIKYQQNQIIPNKIDDQINQIIIELCEFCKKIKEGAEVENTQNEKQKKMKKKIKTSMIQSSQDDFICKEIKGPFRTLFPEEDNNLNSSQKGQFQLSHHQQDSPSFNRFEANQILEPLKKSTKNIIIHKQ